VKFSVVIAEAWRSLTASLSTTIAAALTVLIGMFLVGLLIAFWTFADSWSNQQKGKLVVKVFMCTENACPQGAEATPAQINAVNQQLLADSRVKKVRFVSKEEGLKQMRKDHPELVGPLVSNPLPDSFTVTPIKGEYTKGIAESFDPPPAGVEKATYGAETASRVLKAARVIKGSFLLAGLILIIASAMLIANTIRLSIFARRREIEVMKLVGASNWFIRGPFILEGIACGVIGSLLAVILLIAGKELALPQIIPRFDAGEGVHAWPFPVVSAILLLLGLSLGATGSALTLRRFLRI
jgi:cell division transport system permease protein